MSAIEPLSSLAGSHTAELTKEELFILEAELFIRLFDELKETIKIKYKSYFSIIKPSHDMENAMIEEKFVRCIVNDILESDEYTLSGIAAYTDTPEEVIHEIIIGRNTNPSVLFFRKIIELHRSIRRDLYKEIFEKTILRNCAA